MAYYQENTLSIATRTYLAQLLAELITTNHLIEDYRQQLAALPFFHPLPLFRLLDRNQKGLLVEKDLQEVMGTTHRKLLTYAFSWIDLQKVGEVSRFQFACFLVPRDNLQLREAMLRSLEAGKEKEEIDGVLHVHFGKFQELLRQLMNREMILIELRRSIMACTDYSLQGVRSALNNCHRKWISPSDIHTFLHNFGFEVTIKDTEALVEAFAIQGEGSICLEILKWIVEGLQNSKDKAYLSKVKAGNKKKPQKPRITEKPASKQQKNSQKKVTREGDDEFRSLVAKFQALQRQQKRNERRLIQSEKRSVESARKAYKQDLARLHLRREEQSLRKSLAREAKLTHRQMEFQIDQILNRTAQLQEDSNRIIRQSKRISIREDSESIRKEIQSELYLKQYERMVKTRQARKRLNLSPSIKNDLRRQSIETHILASEQYLNNAKYVHQRILRDRKQQSLIREKENQISNDNKRKTPGLLINKTNPPNQPSSLNTQDQSKQKEIVSIIDIISQ